MRRTSSFGMPSSSAIWSMASLTMMPVVWSFSPTSAFLSSTWTRMPARVRALAQASPAKLAPTTPQSDWNEEELLTADVVVADELAPARELRLHVRVEFIGGTADRIGAGGHQLLPDVGRLQDLDHVRVDLVDDGPRRFRGREE